MMSSTIYPLYVPILISYSSQSASQPAKANAAHTHTGTICAKQTTTTAADSRRKRDLFYRLSTIAVADIIDIAHPSAHKIQNTNNKCEMGKKHTLTLYLYSFFALAEVAVAAVAVVPSFFTCSSLCFDFLFIRFTLVAVAIVVTVISFVLGQKLQFFF